VKRGAFASAVRRDALAILGALCLFSDMKKLLAASAFFAALAGTASAYTAYVMPDAFLPSDRSITLQGAYATSFFTPGSAVGGQFAVIEPDGADGFFNQAEVTTDSTRLSATLFKEGTYRFSSGEQLGPVSNMVGVDGGWRQLQAGETPPEGAPTTTLQTVTVAETYVTLGAPNRTAVDRTIGRLALRPITHPNQVVAGQGFQVNATFDGAPFANAALVLYKDGEPETDLDRFATTDASGNATLTLDGPGRYVLVARHRASAPAGSQAQIQSFTTSLVFEAVAALPPVVHLQDSSDERRPRRRTRLH
jgi:hypothetical protein